MPNTYTQIHIHLVFAVKYRDAVISPSWKEELYKYITGIVQNNTHKLLIINGMPDHVHLLIGLRPKQALSDLVREIKSNSSKWINEKRFLKTKFEWQEGFGAFSYGKTELSKIIKYIENQEEHHSEKSFKEEYLDFLKAFQIEFEEQYVFHELLERIA
jgi:putative transposase